MICHCGRPAGRPYSRSSTRITSLWAAESNVNQFRGRHETHGRAPSPYPPANIQVAVPDSMQAWCTRIESFRNVNNREKLSPMGVPAQLEADAQRGRGFKVNGLVIEQDAGLLWIEAGNEPLEIR